MIETNSDCQRFKSENEIGEWILHIVPVEDGVHPADNVPCLLFVRNVSTGKSYYYSFNHPDSKSKITDSYFIQECILNANNVKWALDKKAFNQFLHIPGLRDINLCVSLEHNDIMEWPEFETSAHNLVRRNCDGFGQVNKAVPLMKHLETFDNMCEDASKTVRKFVMDDSYNKVNSIILETLGEIEANGIYVDVPIFAKFFNTKPNSNGMVFSQYNIYTSTGRPSNRYGGVNYAALNHTDGSRAAFVSRYGKDGRMVVVDYTTFHPRIVCNLTKYHIPVETEIYDYLAKLYFQKQEIDETDIANAKKLTFRQMYGGVEPEYEHIKWLASLKTYMNEQWDFFQKNGYVLTPFFKRKISDKHISDPNPPKVFNYLLQAAEGEVALSRISLVLKYLRSRKSRVVLYTYDAILMDFHKEDGLQTLNEIRNILSDNNSFPTKTYVGNSYHDVRLVAV